MYVCMYTYPYRCVCVYIYIYIHVYDMHSLTLYDMFTEFSHTVHYTEICCSAL